MNKSTGAKRQARAMLVTTVLIAAMAAVIILFGVQQSRREKTTPPPDTVQSDTVQSGRRDGSVTTADKPPQGEESRPAETKIPKPETSAVTEEAAPTAVADPLPEFIAPVTPFLSIPTLALMFLLKASPALLPSADAPVIWPAGQWAVMEMQEDLWEPL